MKKGNIHFFFEIFGKIGLNMRFVCENAQKIRDVFSKNGEKARIIYNF
jgi:hypothetical protein